MDQLSRIERGLGEVDGKLDLVLQQLSDHTARLRSLEDTRTKAMAVTGLLGALWGYVAKALTVVTLASFVAKGMPPELVHQYFVAIDYVTGSV